MHLHHESDLDAPLKTVWSRAKDAKTVASSFPGGRVTHIDGRDFTGAVSVGVGPVRLTYRGKGTYEELDETRHHAVIVAHGSQARGPGRADIRMTLQLRAAGSAKTHAVLDTDLTLNGTSLPLVGPLGQRIAAPLVSVFFRRLAAGADS